MDKVTTDIFKKCFDGKIFNSKTCRIIKRSSAINKILKDPKLVIFNDLVLTDKKDTTYSYTKKPYEKKPYEEGDPNKQIAIIPQKKDFKPEKDSKSKKEIKIIEEDIDDTNECLLNNISDYKTYNEKKLSEIEKEYKLRQIIVDIYKENREINDFLKNMSEKFKTNLPESTYTGEITDLFYLLDNLTNNPKKKKQSKTWFKKNEDSIHWTNFKIMYYGINQYCSESNYIYTPMLEYLVCKDFDESEEFFINNIFSQIFDNYSSDRIKYVLKYIYDFENNRDFAVNPLKFTNDAYNCDIYIFSNIIKNNKKLITYIKNYFEKDSLGTVINSPMQFYNDIIKKYIYSFVLPINIRKKIYKENVKIDIKKRNKN